MTNISPDIARRLLKRTWEDDMLNDLEAMNCITEQILQGKQYFTAEEVIELLTQDI